MSQNNTQKKICIKLMGFKRIQPMKPHNDKRTNVDELLKKVENKEARVFTI